MGYIDPDCVEGEVNDNYVCAICQLLLDEPTSGCREGHAFCKDCLAKAHESNGTCPTCRAPASASGLTRNRPLENMITSVKVKCVHFEDRSKRRRRPSPASLKVDELRAALRDRGLSEEGKKTKLVAKLVEAEADDIACEWRGTVASYRGHQERDCPMEEVPCGCHPCDVVLSRCRLQRHEEICPMRAVLCQFCDEIVHYSDFLEEHDDVKCEDCDTEVKRCCLVDHNENECPEQQMQCPFFKCDHEALRKDMPQHYVDQAESHAQSSTIEIRHLRHQLEREKNNACFFRGVESIRWSWNPAALILNDATDVGAFELSNLVEAPTGSGIQFQVVIKRVARQGMRQYYFGFQCLSNASVEVVNEIWGSIILYGKDGKSHVLQLKTGSRHRRERLLKQKVCCIFFTLSLADRARCTHANGKLRIAARLNVTSAESQALVGLDSEL